MILLMLVADISANLCAEFAPSRCVLRDSSMASHSHVDAFGRVFKALATTVETQGESQVMDQSRP